MRYIAIPGEYPQDWIRNFTHIANLFYEETKVISEVAEAQDVVELTIQEEAGQLIGRARLNDTYEASFTEDKWQNVTEREERKQKKRLLAHVLLDVLEQQTGMSQSWGILTGIRPTKLYHRARREGKSHEDIKKELQHDYRLSDEKIDLMKTVVDRQLVTIPDLDTIGKEVSVYIGIPFCPTKCAYCTFPAFAIHRKNGRVDNFLDALHVEIRKMGARMKEKGLTITSVYFGGGTPTSIEADEMDALYQTMWDSFPNPESIREITVEAGRPDTITPEKLDVLNKWGIDRISVNPQSYTDETLKAIGRHHSVQETIDKFWLSREMGMNNINMDLIIGLPNEGLEEFTHSLNETEKMQPESLTVHTLSFKRASEMTRNKTKYEVADRETAESMMKLAEKWTDDNGYVPYYLYRQKNILGNLENVGYSKPGEENIYNIVIMEEVQSIIGIGCGASSKFIDQQTGKITQYYNPKDPAAYVLTFEDATNEKLRLLDEVFPSK